MSEDVGIRAVVEVTNKATEPLNDLRKQFEDLDKRLEALGAKAPQAGASITAALGQAGAAASETGASFDGIFDNFNKWGLLAGAIGVVTGALALLAKDAFVVYESVS